MATVKSKGPSVASSSMADEHKWQAQSDLRTLMDAHAIHKDKARHARVKAHAKEQLSMLKNVSTSKPTPKLVVPTK